MNDSPLDPRTRAARLAEVYVALGPVYRRVARLVEQDERTSGLSVGVRNVLDQLRRDGDRTVPQLARAQDLSRQYTQRMVDQAATDGLVELVPNPAHRRSRLARLTPTGAAAIAAVIDRELSLLTRVGGALTAAELDGTLRVLHHMDQALIALEEEPGR